MSFSDETSDIFWFRNQKWNTKLESLTSRLETPQSWLVEGTLTLTLQVFRINFWLNINHINYSSKMAYLCLKCKWKYVNMTKLQGVYLLSLLYCCPDFILSKMLSRCDIYCICMFEFLDHIKFCKVVLNIFKIYVKFSVHSPHFNFYFKWKGEKTKKIQQNI